MTVSRFGSVTDGHLGPVALVAAAHTGVNTVVLSPCGLANADK